MYQVAHAKGKTPVSDKVSINQLANTINEYLKEYSALATSDMKKAVKDSAKTVKSEISKNAPRKSGDYAKSWSNKTTKETANSLEITVHSKNRYQLAHLLEFGHAKRGGGRVAGKSHIAPAEEKGIAELVKQIERDLSK